MNTSFETLFKEIKRVGLLHTPTQSINDCSCGEKYFTHGNTMHEPSNDEWDEVITEHLADKIALALVELLEKEEGKNNE